MVLLEARRPRRSLPPGPWGWFALLSLLLSLLRCRGGSHRGAGALRLDLRVLYAWDAEMGFPRRGLSPRRRLLQYVSAPLGSVLEAPLVWVWWGAGVVCPWSWTRSGCCTTVMLSPGVEFVAWRNVARKGCSPLEWNSLGGGLGPAACPRRGVSGKRDSLVDSVVVCFCC